jgi:phosphohistidine phosphatase SixA
MLNMTRSGDLAGKNFLLPATVLALAFGIQAAQAAQASSVSADLVMALQQGGNIVYIRHASTERDYADQIKAVPGDCSTQRMLSEKGWNEAVLIGAAFDVLSIPVGAVYSSEYCRAWQTAELAFGHNVKLAELNFEPAEEYTAEQLAAMRGRLLPLLSAMPPMATNTVIVGHDDPFEAATGIYPEPMGVAYVVRPAPDGSFSVLGAIPPQAWPALIQQYR